MVRRDGEVEVEKGRMRSGEMKEKWVRRGEEEGRECGGVERCGGEMKNAEKWRRDGEEAEDQCRSGEGERERRKKRRRIRI